MNGKSTETEPLLCAIATSPQEDGASWAVTGASHDAHNWVLCVGHKTFFFSHPQQMELGRFLHHLTPQWATSGASNVMEGSSAQNGGFIPSVTFLGRAVVDRSMKPTHHMFLLGEISSTGVTPYSKPPPR